jgi:integrase
MSARGLAPATVRQAHRVFALVLTLAVRDGRIPRNPATGVPLPRALRAEPRFITRDQVEQLADNAGEYGDVVRLLAYAGLRFGEMAALRVRRIDFLRKHLTVAESATEVEGVVEFGTPKTHQKRTVPIPAVLLEPLSRRCAGKRADDLVMRGSQPALPAEEPPNGGAEPTGPASTSGTPEAQSGVRDRWPMTACGLASGPASRVPGHSCMEQRPLPTPISVPLGTV